MANLWYNIAVIGDDGVGKTTFIRRHLTGEFEEKYEPTEWANYDRITFDTNIGPVQLNIWDYTGECPLSGYHGVIAMFSVDKENSLENAIKLLKMFPRETARVLCCTKCDLVSTRPISEIPEHTILTSTKTKYNLDKPFVELLQIMTHTPDISFAKS